MRLNRVIELCAPLAVAGAVLGLALLTGSKLVVIVVGSALGVFLLFGRVAEWLDRRRSHRPKRCRDGSG